ncbi:metallophosphoesterase family protein [Cesiribacter sp. SM1]|uniref:purple acid phosphatase family protein n=1 Tax=Cesiribacter sp. SM1 TaxID=2861196 RepID=UPI001CD686C5|nr:metallophosphoesterase family protein [Cesiribacter sp. SM1]
MFTQRNLVFLLSFIVTVGVFGFVEQSEKIDQLEASLAAPVLLRQPYLQTALADSISILWRTNKGKNCEVSYKPAGAKEWQKASGVITKKRVGGVENLVTIKGLKAGTVYQYNIFTDGVEMVPETELLFRAPKKATESFTFFSVGDIGEPVDNEGKPDKLAEQISLLNTVPDFGLLLGDIVYPKGESEGYDQHFFNYFGQVFSRVPTFAIPGNHEWMVDPEQNFIQEWKLPGNEHYYSFDWGNTHFIALDSKEGDFYEYEKQKAWLVRDLKKAKAKGYQWQVVMVHHNGKSCTYKKDTKRLIELYPIFDKYGIDLVLNGHAHTYERLNPMNGRGEALPQWIGKTGLYENVKGFISITVGSGGKLRGVGLDKKPFQPDPENCRHQNLVATANHEWAFLRIKIDDNKLEAEAIGTLDGEVLDRFVMTKKQIATTDEVVNKG